MSKRRKTKTKTQRAREAALALGLDPRIVVQRVLDYGWTLRRALSTPFNDGRILKLAAKHGLAPKLVRARLRAGWSLNRALSPIKKKGKFTALCREHGLRDTTVRARMKRGETLQQALSHPTADLTEVTRLALKYGMVSPQVAHQRVCRDGWDVLRAVRSPPTKRIISQQAREHGLPPATVIARLHLGWSLNRALTTPVFSSVVTPAARASGIPESTLRSRITEKRMSVAEAVRWVRPLSTRKRNTRARERARHKCRVYDYLVQKGLPVDRTISRNERVDTTWAAVLALTPTKRWDWENNKLVDNISAVARQHGVNQTTFHLRVKRGLSIDEAKNFVYDRTSPRRRDNLLARAREAGIGYATVRHRLRVGWSLKQALSVPPQYGRSPRALKEALAAAG